MPGRRRALTNAIAAVAAIAVVGLCAGTASASDHTTPPPSVQSHGNQVDIQLTSTTSTQFQDGAGGNTGVQYTAPPCWYQALGDTTAFQTLLQAVKTSEHGSDPGYQGWPDFDQWLAEWESQLAGHESDNPPGTWYESECTDFTSAEAQAWVNSNPDFLYVPPNTTPAAGIPTITPATLAQYALASTILPPPTPQFSPDAGQASYVNLTTWAWQSAGKTLDLTATLGAESATVVMTPASMTLTADSPTAGGVPNVCRQAGSVIGVPYQSGLGEPVAPGCGLRFTTPGTHAVHIDVTWQITWTSPQVTGVQTFADVHMTGDVVITAKEIESIN